jgi:hypothetical protein
MAIDVPSPFSAIGRSGLNLTLSNSRRYNMSSIFGDQYSVAGVSILSGPITLHAQRQGGILQEITATPTVTAEEAGMVTLGWSFAGVGFSASGTTKIYADGRVQFDFSILPAAATKWDKLYWVVPLADGIAEWLTVNPRYDTTETNSKTIPWDYQQPGASLPGWAASNTFPRVVLIHNDANGFCWAMDSDANIAPSISDADGSRRARMSVADDVFRFDMIRTTTPSFSAATAEALEYRFHIMPCPPRSLDAEGFLERFGVENSNPSLTNYRPLTEETGHYHTMGSGVMINETTANSNRAARLAVGLKDLRYVVFMLRPNAESGWNSAWKCTVGAANTGYQNNPLAEGFPQYPAYSVDNLGVTYYSLDPALIDLTAYQDWVIAQLEPLLDKTDGFYWDVTDFKIQESALDKFGRAYFRFSVTATCDFSRRLSAYLKSRGKKLLSHAQGDVCPMRDCFYDWVLPGEQWADDIGNLSGNARRRFYLDSLPEDQLRAEIAPLVWGVHVIIIPGWTETDYLTTDEWFMTEVMAAVCLMHGAGNWLSTQAKKALQPLFQAIKNFAAGRQLTYTPPWHNTLVTCGDSSVRIATFSVANDVLAAVINTSDANISAAVSIAGRSAASSAIRYAGRAQSPAEGRPSPGYTAAISGSDQSFTVGVARKVATLVEFNLVPQAPSLLPAELFGGSDSKTPIVGGADPVAQLVGSAGSPPVLIGPN